MCSDRSFFNLNLAWGKIRVLFPKVLIEHKTLSSLIFGIIENLEGKDFFCLTNFAGSLKPAGFPVPNLN